MSKHLGIAWLLAFGLTQGGSAFGFDDFVGLWVSRFEYNEDSAADIVDRIDRAAEMGVTDVLWQVRGKADAYYHSAYESPAEDWLGAVDPLQTAIDAAHARGMKLHAWINSMPIWRDTVAPVDPGHIFHNTDPSFRVTDINGNVEELVGGGSSFSGSYARVNHVLPEVQDHLNNVARDLAENYAIDGLHLDYIRWLGPSGGSSEGFRPDWDYLPHDEYSHQLYFEATGQDASDGSTFEKREAYRDWVQSRVTDLVESIGATIDGVEADEQRLIELSAAVWNNPTTAERDYMQDYRDWLSRDLLDVAIPMVYLRESNSNLLDGFLDDIHGAVTNTEVAIGLGSYLHTETEGGVDETIEQMQRVYDDGRADGLAFFSYASLLDGSTLSDQRRQAVVDWYDDTFAIPGDFNGDGSVDGADYTVWRNSWLQFGDDLPADADGDGFVGNSDRDIWLANFGATNGGSPAGVPEPATWGVAISALLMVIALGRDATRPPAAPNVFPALR